jgi:uncharacterized Zn ribbon protein
MPTDTSKMTDEEYAAYIVDYRRDRSIPCVDKNGNPLKRGDRVRIFKGTKLRHMKDGSVITKKTYVVTLHDAHRGYEGQHEIDGEPGAYACRPEAMWPGRGGYWTDCDSTWVELVKEQK